MVHTGRVIMEKKKYTVIGGDLRNVILAKLLKEEGNQVFIHGFSKYEGFGNYAFDDDFNEVNNLTEAIDDSDVIIGPLPCSLDNETINTTFHNEKIYLNEIFKSMKKNQLFTAGLISEKILQLAEIYSVYAIDYFKRDEMAVLNAIPTAEGAIQIAMEELPFTLHGSNTMVLGFGRVGKTLAKTLYGIGAKVYVEARNYSDIAWIRNYGYQPVLLSNLDEYLPDMAVIFNTIPHIILDKDRLLKLNKNCLVIDLASKPGGVDLESAKSLGIKTIWALSLPGKVAPLTAAEIIRDTIYNIIDELGV